MNIYKIIKEGVILEDGYRCKPARLEILDSSKGNSKANIFITEGKFHQVKRMNEVSWSNS